VEDSKDFWERRRHAATLRYRLCPGCFRAVPASSSERYCINDGMWLLEGCPLCNTSITNPYARYCATCGLEFASINQETLLASSLTQ
jgi:hypothetical protein